jgi:hypothetical protein
MSEEEEEETPQGSWTPMIIVLLLVLIRWIVFGQGSIVPVRVRRWYNMKRVKVKKEMGYRDESKYKMKTGDGANQKYKRQG